MKKGWQELQNGYAQPVFVPNLFNFNINSQSNPLTQMFAMKLDFGSIKVLEIQLAMPNFCSILIDNQSWQKLLPMTKH